MVEHGGKRNLKNGPGVNAEEKVGHGSVAGHNHHAVGFWRDAGLGGEVIQ